MKSHVLPLYTYYGGSFGHRYRPPAAGSWEDARKLKHSA